jgi:hypothetical protein
VEGGIVEDEFADEEFLAEEIEGGIGEVDIADAEKGFARFRIRAGHGGVAEFEPGKEAEM